MAFTLADLESGGTEDDATEYTTGSFTSTANKPILLWLCANYAGTPTTPTVTKTGCTFTFVEFASAIGLNSKAWLFRGAVTSTDTGTATITYSETMLKSQWHFLETDGADASNPIQGSNHSLEGYDNTATSWTATLPGAYTAGNEGQGGYNGHNNATKTIESGWTYQTASVGAGNGYSRSAAQQDTDDTSITFTLDSSYHGVAGIWEVKAASSIEQEGFQWYDDDAAEGSATTLAAQDANITRAKNTNTRLRLLLNATGDPASTQYKLQYKRSADPTSEWEDLA
jgi:hypothetical protein